MRRGRREGVRLEIGCRERRYARDGCKRDLEAERHLPRGTEKWRARAIGIMGNTRGRSHALERVMN